MKYILKSFCYLIVQLLKSWEYKNLSDKQSEDNGVVQLLKSWEYKNRDNDVMSIPLVVQLLKSWEYKNRLGLGH